MNDELVIDWWWFTWSKQWILLEMNSFWNDQTWSNHHENHDSLSGSMNIHVTWMTFWLVDGITIQMSSRRDDDKNQPRIGQQKSISFYIILDLLIKQLNQHIDIDISYIYHTYIIHISYIYHTWTTIWWFHSSPWKDPPCYSVRFLPSKFLWAMA